MSDIVLGYGVFTVGTTDIALNRGGGKFVVEREYRQIEADGDYGPVKGRIRKVKSVAKLTMNSLELLPANIAKLYPATTMTTDALTSTDTIKAKANIEDADYNSVVKWTGKTHSGKNVIITLENAINLENIDWTMTDKDEVVPTLTFTATYLEGSDDEPWKIEYVTPA